MDCRRYYYVGPRPWVLRTIDDKTHTGLSGQSPGPEIVEIVLGNPPHYIQRVLVVKRKRER